MRHIGFLVIGSEFTLDGEEEDLEIPFFLKPTQETSSQCDPVFFNNSFTL